MPHVVVELSANLSASVSAADLVSAVHAAALATGIAPLDALRTRAIEHADYAVADRHPDNAFVAISVRLGPGRSVDERQRLANAMLDAAERVLGPAVGRTMLSAEVTEIDTDARVNRNHVRPHVHARLAAGDRPDA